MDRDAASLSDPAQRRWLILALERALRARLPELQIQGGSQADPRDPGGFTSFASDVGSWVFRGARRVHGIARGALGRIHFRDFRRFCQVSHGSEVAWMWQPPSFDRLREFFWSSRATISVTTLQRALAFARGGFGTFSSSALGGLSCLADEAFDRCPGPGSAAPVGSCPAFRADLVCRDDRGRQRPGGDQLHFPDSLRNFAAGASLALLAWRFGLVAESWEGRAKTLPKWAAAALAAMCVVKLPYQLQRSLRYRHDMGQVMVAVDQAYDEVASHHAGDRLALLPDFRPYDYRPDAPGLFHGKTWLHEGSELANKNFPEGQTSVISWKPSLWDRLEIVNHFSGCRSTTLVVYCSFIPARLARAPGS